MPKVSHPAPVLAGSLACALALASPGAAQTPNPATAGELVALCDRDAYGCTQAVVMLEMVVLLNEPPPYACFMNADYSPPHTFRPAKMAALKAWMAAHPEPAAAPAPYAHRAALAVFPETQACLEEANAAVR